MTLPPWVSTDEVQRRLLMIFSEGSEVRDFCTRESGVRTVFVMLYVGAVQGAGRAIIPKHVYRMSDEQAARTSDAERLAYASEARKPGFLALGTTWYADNSRESVRDETIRNGLLVVGAARSDASIPTTSNLPRYALDPEFAALFDPTLSGDALSMAINSWQAAHLSAAALASIALRRAGAVGEAVGVSVTFPSGETRRMGSGLSSVITKAVIEEFAPRFLTKPAVLWVSESGRKVVQRDDLLAKSLNLNIDPSRNLPDVILVDADPHAFLIVFVEIVATDGAITSLRRTELMKVARDGGFAEDRVAFVTAYVDREHPGFKKTFPALAWNSFAWLASVPTHIVALMDPSTVANAKLRDLMSRR